MGMSEVLTRLYILACNIDVGAADPFSRSRLTAISIATGSHLSDTLPVGPMVPSAKPNPLGYLVRVQRQMHAAE